MNTFIVTTLSDSDHDEELVSLRDAITSVNKTDPGSENRIFFKVQGVITLDNALPGLQRSVAIDATAGPDYDGSTPVVAVDCHGSAGFVFARGSEWSQLLGLAIYNAGGYGVTLQAGNTILHKNWIGLDLNGTKQGNTDSGVYVSAGSSNNQIGFNPTATTGIVSNVISGNGGNGITIQGSTGNEVVCNYIGTDPTGSTAIPNAGSGIQINRGSHNMIGGVAYTDTTNGAQNDPTGNKGSTEPVFVVPPLGNLISGNGGEGVLLYDSSSFNVLSGNFIGTTADGNAPLGNAANGVQINGSNNNALIGCTFEQNPFVYYNVVSGNGGQGLHIVYSNDIAVHANFFGISADNSKKVPNAGNGILVSGISNNVTVGGVIPLGNVCAGNGENGIEVRDQVSGFTTFNTFGGLFAFGGAAGNGRNGLLITATGGNQTVQTNVFSGNAGNGIEISGDASGITIDPNIAGLNTIGAKRLANQGSGLLIGGTAHGIVVGGSQKSVMPQNTFSGNDQYGIAIIDSASDIIVKESVVGTDILGTYGIANKLGGILVGDKASNNTIGGETVGNLIGSNIGSGITLAPGTNSNQILDNSIGYDKSGNPLLVNTEAPIINNSGTGDNTISGNKAVTVCDWSDPNG